MYSVAKAVFALQVIAHVRCFPSYNQASDKTLQKRDQLYPAPSAAHFKTGLSYNYLFASDDSSIQKRSKPGCDEEKANHVDNSDGEYDYPPEDYPPEDTPPEDYPPEDTPPEDYPPDDTPHAETLPDDYPPPEDTLPGDTPPEDTPPEDTPPEDTPPEDYPPDGTPPTETLPDDTPPEDTDPYQGLGPRGDPAFISNAKHVLVPTSIIGLLGIFLF
jgi:hypothetical protein